MIINRTWMPFAVIAPSLACLLAPSPARAQDAAPNPQPEVIRAVRHDVSRPLRDLPVRFPEQEDEVENRVVPRTPAISNVDPVVQTPTADPLPAQVLLNFDANVSGGAVPPDTNGSVGSTQYVQWVNVVFSVYDKNTGNIVGGPFPGTHFWQGFGGMCETLNGGDPQIHWDNMADRWVALQLAYNGNFSNNSVCMAVSTGTDALGSYNRYEFNFANNLPDYPKLGIWPDAYYVTSNTFPNGGFFIGAKTCAMDRTRMLAGQSATAVCFQRPNSDAFFLPSDLDGPTPPPQGSPNFHIELKTSTTLNLFKFHVDFVNPGLSTFTGPTNITVASYTDICPFTRACIPQPSPGEFVDAFSGNLMYRLPYRNFGDHESIVATHTVDKGGNIAGVRWYEIRGLSGTPSVFQQGTLSTNAIHVWMPSIAMDKMGNILLGVNGSNAVNIDPSLAFTGRVAADPLGQLRKPSVLIRGTGVQTAGVNRWGDYAAMAVDETDDCTFWFTGEYYKTTGARTWSTRVGSIKFDNCN